MQKQTAEIVSSNEKIRDRLAKMLLGRAKDWAPRLHCFPIAMPKIADQEELASRLAVHTRRTDDYTLCAIATKLDRWPGERLGKLPLERMYLCKSRTDVEIILYVVGFFTSGFFKNRFVLQWALIRRRKAAAPLKRIKRIVSSR